LVASLGASEVWREANWPEASLQPELAAASPKDAGARRGATGRAVRLSRLLGGLRVAGKPWPPYRGSPTWARDGHRRGSAGRAVRRRAGAWVRRSGVPGAGRRAARIFGTPRRACHLGMEQVRWEGTGRRVDRGTAREGAGRRRWRGTRARTARRRPAGNCRVPLFERVKLQKVE
jgi:hypothetical protein